MTDKSHNAEQTMQIGSSNRTKTSYNESTSEKKTIVIHVAKTVNNT